MVSCKTPPQVDQWPPSQREERKWGGNNGRFWDDGFLLFLFCSCSVVEVDGWSSLRLIISNVFSWVLIRPELRDLWGGNFWSQLLLFVSILQHEDGVVNLQGRSQLNREDLDDVCLGEQKKGLAIYLLKRENESDQLHTAMWNKTVFLLAQFVVSANSSDKHVSQCSTKFTD